MAIFDPMAAARRRRLYLFGLIPTSSGNGSPGSTAPGPTAADISTTPSDIQSPPVSTSRSPVIPGSARPPAPVRRNFRPLREAVQDRQNSITWLFTGQSLPGQLGEASEIPLSGIVGLNVRNYLERTSDPIIDTTGPDLRVIDLLQQFETRIERFQPHVVVIGGSLIEADRGIDGLPKFERNLVRLIHACRRLGSDVVLQTPRFVPSASQAEEIDGPVYIEAIRSLAAEQGVGLVDHWSAEAVRPLNPAVHLVPDPSANAFDVRSGGGRKDGDGMTLLARFVNDLELPGADSNSAAASGTASRLES